MSHYMTALAMKQRGPEASREDCALLACRSPQRGNRSMLPELKDARGRV